jgi:hypothetical protein
VRATRSNDRTRASNIVASADTGSIGRSVSDAGCVANGAGWTASEAESAALRRASNSPSLSEGRVSRTRRTPLQDVVAGPLAEQDSAATWPNGSTDEEASVLAHQERRATRLVAIHGS